MLLRFGFVLTNMIHHQKNMYCIVSGPKRMQIFHVCLHMEQTETNHEPGDHLRFKAELENKILCIL